MATITRHTSAHIAATALVAGGSVVAGVVMAARDGGAAVFPSVSCKRNRLRHGEQEERDHNNPEIMHLSVTVPGGQVHV